MFLSLITALLIQPAQADTRTYDIKGMHCGGCVSMIKDQVCKLPGVESCDVKMNKVTLKGGGLDDNAVKAAVAKAGDYSVVSVEHADAVGASDQKPQPGPTLPAKHNHKKETKTK